MDETIEKASVSGSNKRAKTIASSTKTGLPISNTPSGSNRLTQNVEADKEEIEDTIQVLDVKEKVEDEELLTFDESIKAPGQVGPFSISHTVDADDRKLIQYVFDPKLDKSEIIVSYSNFFLNRDEFTTLGPRGYLYNSIINIAAQNLTDVEWNKRFNWYLPIWFSGYALGDVSHFMEYVKNYKIRESYMSHLVDCHMIFIPIHVESNKRGHYYLYAVDVKKEIAEIWDSLSECTSMKDKYEKVRKILIALDNLFVEDIKDNFPEGWAFANFNVAIAEDIPTQPNGFDCGMFVIKFMKSAGDKSLLTPKFQSDEERFALALDLLKDDRNETRETLLKRAQEHHDPNKEKNQRVDGLPAPSIPEKLQQKKTEDFTSLGLLGDTFDQNLLSLKENLKRLTSKESYAKKQLEQLGSHPSRNSKSEVEKWLKNIDQSKNKIIGLEEEVRRLAEEVGKLVGGLPAPLRLGDHELNGDQLQTEELNHALVNSDYGRYFLYSAFYPEKVEIIREELIMNFIDEGLIHGNSLEAQVAEGHAILDKLEGDHLLECGSFSPLEEYTLGGPEDPDEKWLKGGIVVPEIKWVKMFGDSSRAKAISVIKESPGFMVEAGLKLKEIPYQRRWSDMEKVSLMYNSIEEIPRGLSLKCPKLTTLIIKHNPLKEIPDSFFDHMPALEVLDLSYTNIKVLPKSISGLKSLSSLLLRSCSELNSVPPLGSLQGLMRLDFSHTKIYEVPKGLENAVNLRWFNLSYSELLTMDT
ncbi:hypothetical protein L6164_018505 [Bauhinia variegata]|uniref:Uncharacterized protein n=1 Tax=Bauhinia variegata TaxID=167791 RepID=A0ACB9NC22_BAUVA|nr:hypothetical protein L6164_018505 [Bauhinia variegata]